MNIEKTVTLITTIALLSLLAACSNSEGEATADNSDSASSSDTHTHDDDSEHADHDADHESEDHAHDDEVSLGTFTIGAMKLELAQGHGSVEGGKEGHLVVKLPYTDNGTTIIRAWIGIEDRTLSYVGMGEYAPSHDDYDIHSMAPDPLPENAMWWIEIEKPDGAKVVGSAKPIME